MRTPVQTGIGIRRVMAAAITATALAAPELSAQTSADFQHIRTLVEQMQKTIEAQNARIAELEKAKGTPSPPPVQLTPSPSVSPAATAEPPPSLRAIERAGAGQDIGHRSPITYRGALNDQQDAASRPKDFTLDPTYQGFFPIPNTPVMLKINAKPRVDLISDNMNSGDIYRFVPAKFPLEGSPSFGGGAQSGVNANGSQLRLDVRAPELEGDFRFYYQNDFFGSDTSNMKYRLQQLYGQFYGFKAGFTYGVFEDPDSWPDTVDYEGPNSLIFSRRPVAQYSYAWSDNWNTTFGIEQPDIYVDLDSDGQASASQINRMPDLGFNTRYEVSGLGHFQFSTLFRDIGAMNDAGRVQHVLGWGVNLGAGIDLSKNDTLQLLGVYGNGVGGQGNDAGFLNSDAAFGAGGTLEALPYWSAMIGYTHRWSEQFRSTLTYGYVNLDSLTSQPGVSGAPGEFYNTSQYASANLVWQLRKRLSIGLEGLYGLQEALNGVASGNHWRVQAGMVYSLFD